MFEFNLTKPSNKKSSAGTGGGPGGTTVKNSYQRADGGLAEYFGQVSQADFITPTALRTLLGNLGSGVENSSSTWLKFGLDGKTLFIPSNTIITLSTWQTLYQKGMVYGDDTTGKYPSGSPVVQSAKVTIQGYTFRVRCLRSAAVGVDPGGTALMKDSEIARLLWPVNKTAVSGSEGTGWDSVTQNAPGHHTLCMESATTTANGIVWGYEAMNSVSSFSKISSNPYVSWRPVLELVP